MRYTKDHAWIDLQGEVAAVGVTAYAAGQLGDVQFVELPRIGQAFKAGDELAAIETVKASSDLFAPIDGEVVETNAALGDTPEMITDAPESRAWFIKLKVADLAQVEALMDRAAYEAVLDGL